MAEPASWITGGGFIVAGTHPALPGHFPGHPLVPGVMLLEEAMALILAALPGRRLGRFGVVKFVRPVYPGDRVGLRYALAPPDGLRFDLAVGGKLALRAQGFLAAAEP